MIDIETIISNQALKDEDNLEVAYQTYRSFSQIQNIARERFVCSLIEVVNKVLIGNFTKLDCKWDFCDYSISHLIRIDITNPSWNEKFNIGIYDYDSDRLYFSVKFVDENNSFCQTVHSQIKSILNEGVAWENHWWSLAKDPYNRWESDIVGLKQIAFSDPIALNYFTDRILTFVAAIEKIRLELMQEPTE